MLRFAVLGSGSSGNSAVVCLGDTSILIDAGLSAKQLCLRLQHVGVDPDSLSAIVLTHEHGDHMTGIDVFMRKRQIPVYATTHTCEMVREKVKSELQFRKFQAGSAFEVDGINVESFSVPHDAVDPVGFIFRGNNTSLGVLSDVGHVTGTILDRLRGVDSIFTEANYDDVMLQNDIKRPWSIKQRISNRHGHLSNDQTADLVAEIASERLRHVVLGHLSSDCNTPELAGKIIGEKLISKGFDGVEIAVAERKIPLEMREVAHKAPSTEAPSPHHEVSYPLPTPADDVAVEEAPEEIAVVAIAAQTAEEPTPQRRPVPELEEQNWQQDEMPLF